MSHENKILAEKIIFHLQKSKNGILPKRKLIEEFSINIIKLNPILLSLSDDFDLVKTVNENNVRLTDKGWKFTNFIQLEKDSKKTPLTLYNKIHIGLTIVSLILVSIFGFLNYNLNQDKYDLLNQNKLLNSDLVRCKESLNLNTR